MTTLIATPKTRSADKVIDEEMIDEAWRRLRAARLWISKHRPYYTPAMFACEMYVHPGVPTMGIDSRWNIYANPAFTASLTVEQAAAVLVHELHHGLRNHSDRADLIIEKVGTPKVVRESDGAEGAATSHTAAARDTWNLACDAAINDDLLRDGLELPTPRVLPGSFDFKEGRLEEEYYRRLCEMKRPYVEVGVPCCGSGSGGNPLPCEDDVDGEGDKGGEGSGLSETSKEYYRRITAEAVSDHEAANGIGTAPGGLARWAQRRLKPKVDWRRVLTTHIKKGVERRKGTVDYTYLRPSRRPDLGGVILPGFDRPHAEVAAVIDTSGSMGTEELEQALTEVEAILRRAIPGESLMVLCGDTQFTSAARVFHRRQVELVGGGGTDMGAGIHAALKVRPAVIIVITDGYTPWPESRPPGPKSVVIAALLNKEAAQDVPPWIKTVVIEKPKQEDGD